LISLAPTESGPESAAFIVPSDILPPSTELAANFDFVTAAAAILAFVTEPSLMSFVPSPFIPTQPLHTTSPAMVTASAYICSPSDVTPARKEAPMTVPTAMTRTHVKETLGSLILCKRRVLYRIYYGIMPENYQ
jgi:hypothetical protein